MQSHVKGFTYGHLLAHTVPGAFLAIQLVVMFEWITGAGIFNLDNFRKIAWPNITMLLILWFVAASLLGNVIDAVHHAFFKSKERQVDDTVLEYLSNAERLSIYARLVDDDYWYPYEFYANILVSMMPLLGMMLFRLYELWRFPTTLQLIGIFVYLFVMGVLIDQALDSLRLINDVQKRLEKAFRSADELQTKSAPSETPRAREQESSE